MKIDDDYTPENVEGVNGFEAVALLYAVVMLFVCAIAAIILIILMMF